MTSELQTPPRHVVILGLGPSCNAYLDLAKRLGSRHVLADEVWAINAIADVVQCDRVFHMDDVRIQEARAEAMPESNIAHMLGWLRKHPGPIYTSRLHPDYPGLVEFPLQDVLNSGGFAYFNSTTAYAVAFAIHLGVSEISFFGIDYTLPNIHSGEAGRGCVEFWIGIAMARGIKINVPEQTSLMDACVPAGRKWYGYDCVSVKLSETEDGAAVIEFEERADVPTAAEIEARYDHSSHPNPLMKGQ